MAQKLFLKLFKRRITVKVEKLGDEEKAKFLLNELINAVQKSGKSFAHPAVSQGFGSATIWLQDMETNDAKVSIENIGSWEISTKPNFKMLEEK